MALAFGATSQVGSAFFGIGALACPSVTTQASGSTFIFFSSTGAGLNAPTDNKGNSYGTGTPLLQCLFNAGGDGGNLWVCQNGTGGAGHIASGNYSTSGSGVQLFIEITGTGGAYAVFDQSALTNNINNATTQATGSITPTASGSAVVSLVAGAVSTNITIADAGGYNNILATNPNGASNSNFVASSGGLIQTSAAATSDTFTFTAATNIGLIIISLKPSASGPPPVTPQGPMPRQLYVMP